MSIPSLAYQGIPGSFSYLAGRALFPKAGNMIGTSSFRELFRLVASGEAAYGIAPVENSLVGSVHEVYDLMLKYEVSICGETYLKIAHQLMVTPGKAKPAERISQLKKIFSHPKALEQCQNFFEQRPSIERSAHSDTAGSAKFVAQENDPALGAIAGEESAELYGLEIIARNIEDDPRNYTRFVVIKNGAQDDPAADKASLIFTLPHKPASLYSALEIFAARKLNVTKIESRPILGSPFQYNFYIDFEFKPDARAAALQSLDELKKRTETLKVLGLYKSAAVP